MAPCDWMRREGGGRLGREEKPGGGGTENPGGGGSGGKPIGSPG